MLASIATSLKCPKTILKKKKKNPKNNLRPSNSDNKPWAYFRGELIFGGAYYWREFCVSKWVGLDNKNSLKHDENGLKQLKTANTNSLWVYILEDLLTEGYLRLRFGVLFSGGLIFRKFYGIHSTLSPLLKFPRCVPLKSALQYRYPIISESSRTEFVFFFFVQMAGGHPISVSKNRFSLPHIA